MTTTTGSSLDHAIGTDGLLAVRLRDGEVRLRAVDGGTVRVRDTNGHDLDELFSVDRADGSLALRSGHDADLLSLGRGHRPSPDLDIEVPRHATIVIEAVSGEIVADGLLGDQRYRTASGDMTLRAVSGQIAVEGVSGDVDIIATGTAEVTLRTVSGDVALRAGTLSSVRATTTSGDLKLAGRLIGPGPHAIDTVSGDVVLAPAGDVRIEMTTLTGDLRSELGDRSNGRSGGGRGQRTLEVGSGGQLVTFRSLSGDLRVVKPTPVGSPATPVENASATAASDMAASATAASDMAASATAGSTTAGSATAGSAATGSTTAPRAEPSTAESGTETERVATVPGPIAASPVIAAAYDDARLRILRSLERGEIDVAEAGRRLEALDGGEPASSAVAASDG